MKSFFCATAVILLLQSAAFADQTKPTPEPDIHQILKSLDCAGSINGESVRLKPGVIKETEGEYEILAETSLKDFPKSFLAIGNYTSRDKYVVHGDKPETFMFLIDKLGVHGAHNASLEFPLSPGELYNFECYFY